MNQKYTFVLLIICCVFISGCSDEMIVDSLSRGVRESIVDGMFGILPWYSADTDDWDDDDVFDDDEQYTEPDEPCQPYGSFDGTKCVCFPGYIAYGLDCVPGNRECIYDNDCGTNYCEGDYKIVYRCDLRTYQCTPSKGVPDERVNCKTEFGPEYICSQGLCVYS